MSTLHQQLDEMDRKLNVMETEVKDADHVSMDTNAYKELYREQILQEHQEMVRLVVANSWKAFERKSLFD